MGVIGDIHRGNAHLKLIDFGLSCFQKYDQKLDGQEGSCVVFDTYTPPEHLGHLDVPPSKATDMWRLGCTLYLMLVRNKPFAMSEYTENGKAERQAARYEQRLPAFKRLSNEAKDLIECLIV